MTQNLPYLRCPTCGNVLADKFLRYEELLEDGVSIEAALNKVGLKRYCCRARMINPIKVVSISNRQTDPGEPVTLMNQTAEKLSVALDSEAPTEGALSSLKDNVSINLQPDSDNDIKLPALPDLTAAKTASKPTTFRIYKAR